MQSNVFPANGSVQLTTLVSFDGINGWNPHDGLMRGTDGYFYGTTYAGGSYNKGNVFRVSRDGVFTNLVSFNGTNGAFPAGVLSEGADGNIYGTTESGGVHDLGTVFSMTTAGSLTTLVSFSGTNGSNPQAGLIQTEDLNHYYGTTTSGGTGYSGALDSGFGTAFRLSTNGALTTLVYFGGTNGSSPRSLVRGREDDLYGTTMGGGDSDMGTAFRMSTNGQLTSLVSFHGTNGATPNAGLVDGGDGCFYGTTGFGGTNADIYFWGRLGCGTVFRLTTNGVLTTLFSFTLTNGAFPCGALLRSPAGSFYGTTAYGGTGDPFPDGGGTVFSITTNGVMESLISFQAAGGSGLFGGLVRDTTGDLYGTTFQGGSCCGTVFRLSFINPPVFQSVSHDGSFLVFTWSATTGKTYQVQYSADLTSSNWNNLGGTLMATNTAIGSLDAIGSEAGRFYRIVMIQ